MKLYEPEQQQFMQKRFFQQHYETIWTRTATVYAILIWTRKFNISSTYSHKVCSEKNVLCLSEAAENFCVHYFGILTAFRATLLALHYQRFEQRSRCRRTSSVNIKVRCGFSFLDHGTLGIACRTQISKVQKPELVLIRIENLKPLKSQFETTSGVKFETTVGSRGSDLERGAQL